MCDHTYPPANRDGTCPSCGKPRPAARPAATDEWCACDRAGGQVHPYRTNLAVHEGRSCPETRVVPPRPAANVTDVLAAHADWYDNRKSATECRWLCTCGEQIDDDYSGVNIVARHRAHVAAVLEAGPVAEAERHGAVRGWDECVDHIADTVGYGWQERFKAANPYPTAAEQAGGAS